jgi:hypothetical protein
MRYDTLQYSTYISLFVHQKETIVVLAEEFKGLKDVGGNVGDLSNLFLLVVVAFSGSGCDTNRHTRVGIFDDLTGAAKTGRVTAIDTTVWKIRLPTGGEITTHADQEVITIVGVEVLGISVKVLLRKKEIQVNE